jgi:quercetin dioxygenase-like cupin family protein
MLEALHIVIDPERVPPAYARHRGEEWVYVLSGTLRLECGEETHLLEPGSSAHFDAELPHRLGAEQVLAEVLVVAADSLKELYRHPLFSSKSLVH